MFPKAFGQRHGSRRRFALVISRYRGLGNTTRRYCQLKLACAYADYRIVEDLLTVQIPQSALTWSFQRTHVLFFTLVLLSSARAFSCAVRRIFFKECVFKKFDRWIDLNKFLAYFFTEKRNDFASTSLFVVSVANLCPVVQKPIKRPNPGLAWRLVESFFAAYCYIGSGLPLI